LITQPISWEILMYGSVCTAVLCCDVMWDGRSGHVHFSYITSRPNNMREALARVQMEVGVGERNGLNWQEEENCTVVRHVTCLVVITVRQTSSNSHLVHYFKTNLT
jgi:hypothetical protein